MPHRDPETGQFMSNDMKFDDIEMATFGGSVGVPAADLGGATGFGGGTTDDFEGVELIDYDEFVDRNEELVLLQASHAVSVYANSTESADGTVSVAAEVSADPAVSPATTRAPRPTTSGNAPVGPDDAEGTANNDDSIDIIGRPLMAVGHAPFSDSASGVGGGGSAGEDRYTSQMWPAEAGRFHPRDELFLNGRIVTWNIDDSGVHVNITGQHVYGVVED